MGDHARAMAEVFRTQHELDEILAGMESLRQQTERAMGKDASIVRDMRALHLKIALLAAGPRQRMGHA